MCALCRNVYEFSKLRNATHHSSCHLSSVTPSSVESSPGSATFVVPTRQSQLVTKPTLPRHQEEEKKSPETKVLKLKAGRKYLMQVCDSCSSPGTPLDSKQQNSKSKIFSLA